MCPEQASNLHAKAAILKTAVYANSTIRAEASSGVRSRVFRLPSGCTDQLCYAGAGTSRLITLLGSPSQTSLGRYASPLLTTHAGDAHSAAPRSHPVTLARTCVCLAMAGDRVWHLPVLRSTQRRNLATLIGFEPTILAVTRRWGQPCSPTGPRSAEPRRTANGPPRRLRFLWVLPRPLIRLARADVGLCVLHDTGGAGGVWDCS